MKSAFVKHDDLQASRSMTFTELPGKAVEIEFSTLWAGDIDPVVSTVPLSNIALRMLVQALPQVCDKLKLLD